MFFRSLQTLAAIGAFSLSLAQAQDYPPFFGAKNFGQAPNGSVVIGKLEWLRCGLGETWSGTSCTGYAQEIYSLDDALAAAKAFNSTGGYAGKRDWRLPTVRELLSLRVCRTGFSSRTVDLLDGGPRVSEYCNSELPDSPPTLDVASFPGKRALGSWSSSTVPGSVAKHDGLTVWRAGFHGGTVALLPAESHEHRNRSYVMLVRDR